MPDRDPSRDYDLLDRLVEEFNDRFRRGERPSVREYCDRHPDLADDLRDLLPAIAEVETAKGDAPDPGPAPGTAPALEALGDFRILREIGRGGMGVVYEAEQVSLGRRVALKLLTQRLLRDANQRRRFEREARSAARLHHTNIVPVFGSGEHDGTPYYVMQFIRGTGLDVVAAEVARIEGGPSAPPAAPDRSRPAAAAARSLVTGTFTPAPDGGEGGSGDAYGVTGTFAGPVPGAVAGGVPTGPGPRATSGTAVSAETSAVLSGVTSSVTLPGHSGTAPGRRHRKLTYWQGVARIGAQVADALEYAHQQGIVHRDVKPSNLILDGAGTVWVTDFGLAKADAGDNLTHTGDVLGTLRYMAPEAFDGKADARSDVYALGLTLYELLALRPAFDESDRNKLIKQVTTAEPARLRKVRPAVPRDLETIVHKAIDRDPARRYQRAGELAADLQRFLDDEPIHARRQTATEAAWRWARRHKAVAALVVLSAVVLVAVAVGGVALAAHFRQQEHVQRHLAEANEHLATDNEGARKTAESALEASRQSQRDMKLTLADMYTLQGLQAGPTGRHRDAPLWFAKAAEVGADDPHRVWASRIRAQAWSAELSRPIAAFQHPGDVPRNLTFHPSGRYLLADGPPVPVTRPVIYDIVTGQPVPLPGGTNVRAAALSPSGDRLAISTLTATTVYRFPELTEPEPVGAGGATLLRFSADGNLVALCSPSHAVVWDRKVGATIGTPRPLPSGIQTAEFTTGGERLVTADAKGSFQVFRVRGSATPETTGSHVAAGTGWTTSGPLVVGDRLVTAPGGGKLAVWTLGGSGEPRTITVPFAPLVLARSADGASALATGDGPLIVFRVETGETVRTLENSGNLCAAFHPNGTSVASGGGGPAFSHHSLTTGERMPALGAEATGYRAIAFSRDGRHLAHVGYEGQVRVWALPEPTRIRYSIPTGTDSGHASFGADAASVLVTVPGDSAKLYDAAVGRPIGPPLKPRAGVLSHAHLAPDGGTAVLCAALPDGTGRLELRNPRTGTATAVVGNLSRRPAALAVSANQCAVLCEGGLLRVLDTRSGTTVVDQTTSVSGEFPRVLFSGDGRALAVFDSKRIQVRDADGRLRFPEYTHNDNAVVALSHDGTVLAEVGHSGVLRIWNGVTGARLGPDMRHPTWVDAGVTFHPDAGHVATGGKDGAWRIWHVATGKLIAELPTSSGAGTFSPDGRVFVTASWDGRIETWDWRTGTRLVPAHEVPLQRDYVYTGHRSLVVSPDGRLAAVGGRPNLHVLDLTEQNPGDHGTGRDLLDWGELVSHQEFRGNGPANLRGDEWLRRWQAFRTRHPDRLPGDATPAPPHAIAARLMDAGRWAEAVTVVNDLLARLPHDRETIGVATDLFRAASASRRQGRESASVLNTEPARVVAETVLAASPNRADAAALLAVVLLEAREPVRWTVLRPTAVRSEGGATLTVQADGSVLASGKLARNDSYTVDAIPALSAIRAVRLEAIPDPSLPNGGFGRHGAGSFHLTEFSLTEARIGANEEPRAVKLARAAASYRRSPDRDTTMRDGPHGAIDGTHSTRWDPWHEIKQVQSLVAEPAAPITGGQLIAHLDFLDPRWGDLTLGRFRLSVTDRPNVARDENLIALGEWGSGWLQLGVARIVRGEWDRAIDPLTRAAAQPNEEYDANMLLALVYEHLGKPTDADRHLDAALKHTRTIDPLVLEMSFDVVGPRLARDPKNVPLLLRRFRWHATLGHTTEAAADLQRAFEVDPNAKLDQQEVVALYTLTNDAAARDEWPTAAAALDRLLTSGPPDTWTGYRAATVHAYLGNEAAYKRVCEQMLTEHGSTTHPQVAARAAKACLLLPGEFGQRAVVRDLAALAVRGTGSATSGSPWEAQVMGLAEYRAGRFAAATERFEGSLRAAPPGAASHLLPARLASAAGLAMSLYRQGKIADARRALADATQFVPADAIRRGPSSWHDWLVADVLRREAEALMAPAPAPAPRELK